MSKESESRDFVDFEVSIGDTPGHTSKQLSEFQGENVQHCHMSQGVQVK